MTGAKRLAAWVFTAAGALVVLGLAFTFRVLGLDAGGDRSNTIGLLVTVVGLAFSVYGVHLTRGDPPTAPTRRRQTDSPLGGPTPAADRIDGEPGIGD